MNAMPLHRQADNEPPLSKADVISAIGNGAIIAHFQPQMQPDGSRICMVEALARWCSVSAPTGQI
ncbi:MAG: hypothetical protein FJX29_14600 [Alphaproteobacteria bacterium]|nr:hypothetical protein [Alphaproteobacteria bacterium]